MGGLYHTRIRIFGQLDQRQSKEKEGKPLEDK